MIVYNIDFNSTLRISIITTSLSNQIRQRRSLQAFIFYFTLIEMPYMHWTFLPYFVSVGQPVSFESFLQEPGGGYAKKFIFEKNQEVSFLKDLDDEKSSQFGAMEYVDMYKESNFLAHSMVNMDTRESDMKGSLVWNHHSSYVHLPTWAAEHKGCNWGMKMFDGCSLDSCVRSYQLAYASEIKSIQLYDSVEGPSQR